ASSRIGRGACSSRSVLAWAGETPTAAALAAKCPRSGANSSKNRSNSSSYSAGRPAAGTGARVRCGIALDSNRWQFGQMTHSKGDGLKYMRLGLGRGGGGTAGGGRTGMGDNVMGSTQRSGTCIEAAGLARRFGEVAAVAGIDLAIGYGEIYGFL